MERQKSGSFTLLIGRILVGPPFPKRSQLLHRATHVHSARHPVKAIKLCSLNCPSRGFALFCIQSIT